MNDNLAIYQPYAEYKESGVEWLGEIPSGWELNKVGYLFDFGRGLLITKANLTDKGIECVNYGEIHSKFGFQLDTNIHSLKFVDLNYLKTSPKSLIKNGDLVFADTSEDLEGAGNFTHLTSDKEIFAGYHTVIVRPHERRNSKFFAYVFDSQEFRSQIQLAVKGVKVFSITQAILKKSILWLPPKTEQTRIANFLDHETAKIDNLITKQQRLIELLTEKRQAVISHAVTKGLNPNAPMKDSGIEWLGEIPEGWDVLPTKRVFKLIVEPAPKDNDYELLSVYTKIGVKPRKELEQKGNKASTTDGYWKVKKGDIIVNKLLAWMGAIGYSNYEGVTSPAYDILRATKPINSKFYHYLFRTKKANTEFKRWSRGIMEMRLRLYFDELGNISIPIPPVHEMSEIVNKIEIIDSQFDNLIQKANHQIDLLKERRTALISSAVTGKIDVRNWQEKK